MEYFERKLNLDVHLDAINARLPGASPEAAYALGLLTAFVLRHGVKIPEVILDGALEVKSMYEAVDYGKAVWEMRDRPS